MLTMAFREFCDEIDETRVKTQSPNRLLELITW